MTKKELFDLIIEIFTALPEVQAILDEKVEVKAKSLTPEEAIGNTERKDYPILTGKDVMIEHGEMIPVMSNNGIKVMSMGFLIDSQDTPIIWRGPQKSGSIKQFMADTAWGDLDVLIIDNPPGTGDEPLTVLQSLPNVDAVIMVTTPNVVSQEDVLKCVKMVQMMNIDKIGLIENMAYYVCPHCDEKLHIFGEGNG